jgi:magnesium chelatase family protein
MQHDMLIDARQPLDDLGLDDAARRIIEAAGGRPILLLANPGSGAVMLARRIAKLTTLNPGTAWEATATHRGVGLLRRDQDDFKAGDPGPLRAPHHTISDVALAGGGSKSTFRPGECALAHSGTLFLDEGPEFRRSAMEVIGRAHCDGSIRTVRSTYSVTTPTRFRLVVQACQCACGGNRNGRHEAGYCNDAATIRYHGRLNSLWERAGKPYVVRIDR